MAAKIDKVVNLCSLVSMSRLTIEIDPEQHRQIKTLATFAGLTIKDFILSKTLPGKSRPADETVRGSSSTTAASRLKEAIATPESEHLVFTSLKELEDALGV